MSSSRLFDALAFGFAGICCVLMTQAVAAPEASSREIIGYVFARDRAISSGEIDPTGLTRINYAFANVRDGEVVEGFAHDAENYRLLRDLRQRNPLLEILVSVGGWTWSGNFSDAALSPASRKRFVDSSVRFLSKYQLDGIDIDWEYPGSAGIGNRFRSEDKTNYTALLRDLRQALDAAQLKLKRPLLLTVAAGASAEWIANTEMDRVSIYVDTVNLMAYDYYESSSDRITGHHAPLHSRALDPKGISAERSVAAFLAAGVPAGKLVLGVPFYGHSWSDVSPSSGGLFQPGKPSDLQANFHNISEQLLSSGFTRHWDAEASAPFLYNPSSRIFISYEDTQSVHAKACYARGHNLRGIMFWEYFGDHKNELVNAVRSGLAGHCE